MPCSSWLTYSPEPGASVAARRVTLYCIGVSSCFHSASDLTILVMGDQLVHRFTRRLFTLHRHGMDILPERLLRPDRRRGEPSRRRCVDQCVSAMPSGNQKISADISVHATMPRAESSASFAGRSLRYERTPCAPRLANAYVIVPSVWNRTATH